MILTCPNCGTQYAVKDGAIPPQGRQVRCASCKHSWHQDPEAGAVAEPDLIDADDHDEDQSLAEATLIEPRTGPEAEERAFEEAMIEGEARPLEQVDDAPLEPAAEVEPIVPEEAEAPIAASGSADWDAPPQAEPADDDFSPFARSDETEPGRRGPLATILIVGLVVAALAAAFWFLAPPEWKQRVGLSAGGASPLALVTTHMDRQRLESGNELLTVTGRVINPTGKEQDVPPLQAQLRTRAGKVVYSWTIAPPAPSLPPGGSASFNSTKLDVPAGADELTISLGSPA
jgi:predicted Zn finger-like uncharacterized protein